LDVLHKGHFALNAPANHRAEAENLQCLQCDCDDIMGIAVEELWTLGAVCCLAGVSFSLFYLFFIFFFSCDE